MISQTIKGCATFVIKCYVGNLYFPHINLCNKIARGFKQVVSIKKVTRRPAVRTKEAKKKLELWLDLLQNHVNEIYYNY